MEKLHKVIYELGYKIDTSLWHKVSNVLLKIIELISKGSGNEKI